MREIECKFKIENKKELLHLLKQNNCEISKERLEHDTIFVKDVTKIESKPGSEWLRIRKTDYEIELNYKKQGSKKMESQEIEFQVSSFEKAECFLKALGFSKWVEVKKKRTKIKYKEFNICIDEVEQLGTFVEIEILTEEDDQKDYEPFLLKIAEELNIDITKRIFSHYDTMISEVM